jgi:poly-beta-1,6-N-acetyl-D-glucosamine synthase
MEFIFFTAILLALYPHVIYPAILYCLPKKAKTAMPDRKSGSAVAIVCSAYNEEEVIAEKIRNFYSLDWPNVELYLGLDGCTDGTLKEIQRVVSERIKVFSLPRQGKVNVINYLLRQVWQPYVVMTDANSMFKPDAVSALMKNMRDEVGVVCGRLRLVDEAGSSGEGVYWRIETFVKKIESDFGSVIGANGAIYLFKRDLFSPLPANAINDDFSISMHIYEKGYGSIFAEDAIAEERLTTSDADEFRRHIRDSAGHFRALLYLWRLLNPLRGKRFFFYFSHRVLRWIAPFLLLLALFTNILLAKEHTAYQIILALHAAAYGILMLVHFFHIRFKPLYIPYYFMLVNSAILFGFFKNAFGFQKTSWESTKR